MDIYLELYQYMESKFLEMIPFKINKINKLSLHSFRFFFLKKMKVLDYVKIKIWKLNRMVILQNRVQRKV